MGMWGGIRQGIADQRAEQIEDEKLRLSTASEERAIESHNLAMRTGELDLFTNARKMFGSSDGSGSGKKVTGSREVSLKVLTNMLPEDSKLASRLVGVDLKTLNAGIGLVQSENKDRSKNGYPMSPDQIETMLSGLIVETVKPDFDMFKWAEESGLDVGKELTPGVTWKQYFDAAQGKNSFAAESTQASTLFRTELENNLLSKKDDYLRRVASGELLGQAAQAEGKAIEEAISSLTGKNKSTYLATKIVGVETVIGFFDRNPKFANDKFRSMFNRGLEFNSDPEGNILLAQAIKAGVFDVGDSIVRGGRRITLTEETKDKVLALDIR
jgi:hypothetical protein